MAENNRRNFLKQSAAAIIPATGLLISPEETKAHPPIHFGHHGFRPHFNFHFTPWGTFSHMRWGPFNVVRPIYPGYNPNYRFIPQRINSQNNQGRFQTVNPRNLPQGILANSWSDINRDGFSSLDEYEGLNKRCFNPNEKFMYLISKPRGFWEGQSYDMRVFGPKDNLAGRAKGRFVNGDNAMGTLNLSSLSRDLNHGPGNYCIEYLINDKIRERRQFLLSENPNSGIPSLKTPEEMGLRTDNYGMDIFSAANWTDFNNNKTPELYEFSEINQNSYSRDKPIKLALFNGLDLEGEIMLSVFDNNGVKRIAHQTPQKLDYHVKACEIGARTLPPGDYSFTYNVKIDSNQLGSARNDSLKPKKFSII